jgi:Ca-activated chloride channel family protein
LKKDAKLEKKVIFVVTDGEDNESAETLEQAVRRLQARMGRPFTPLASWRKEEHPKHAKRALQIMSERTGGIAFFPQTLDEVDAISRAVAHDIRTQYTIGYKPTTPKSQGGYRQGESGRPFAQLRQAYRPHEERLLCRNRARFRGAVEGIL